MKKISESYKPITEDDRRFDIVFWQTQGDKAIFDAALEMIIDYLILRKEYADKPRLDRTAETFQKV